MNSMLKIVLGAFFVEQVFCYYLGSYPYRYGFPIKVISMPFRDLESWKAGQDMFHGLKVRICAERKEVYCRYRYQYKTGGPYVFVGQVKYSSPGSLLIRIGPCAGLLLLYIHLFAVLEIVRGGGYYNLINGFVVAGAFLFFYFQLSRSVKHGSVRIHQRE